MAQRNTLAGVGAPGDEGFELVSVDEDFLVEDGTFVGGQALPVLDCLVPLFTLGCVLATLDVLEGDLVGGDHAGACARLNGHVAHGHAALHREGADCGAAVFEHVALTAAGTNLRDDSEDDVLCGHAGLEGAFNVDCHGLEACQGQGLGRHDVLHLGGADTERESAERTVGGGVGITADDGHTGHGQTQLRADHVHDALFLVTEGVDAHAEFLGVAAQGLDLGAAGQVGDGAEDVVGGGVVILGGDGQVEAAQGAVLDAQAFECLGGGHFVQ